MNPGGVGYCGPLAARRRRSARAFAGEELVVPIRSARGRRGGRESSFAKGCALVRIARERSSRCPRRARTSRRARCSRARDRHRARRSGVQHPRVGEDVDQVFLSTVSDFFLALRFGNPKAPQSVVCHLHCLHILVLSRNRSCGRSSERRAGSIPRSVLLRFASTRYWYFPLNNRPTFRSLFVSRISRAPGSRAMVASAPPKLGVGTPMDAQLMLPLIDMAQWSTNIAVRLTPTPSPRAAARPGSRGRFGRSDRRVV